MDVSALASGFPAVTRAAWRQAAERALKGRDFDRALIGRTHDGLPIEPLYEKAEGAPRIVGRAAVPWRVEARMDHPDPSEANALVLDELDGGADALAIVLPEAGSARGFGLGATTADALDHALRGVMLDLVTVRLEAGAAGRDAAAQFVALAESRGHPLSGLDLDLGLDPIGAAARTGQLSAPWPVVGQRLSDTLGDLAFRGFAGRLALADGRPYHEAGASEAQELAAVLATGVAYLRALEAGGHALGTARGALSFLLVADADAFMTVAKFRAFRRLWDAVETGCGLEPAPARLAGETAWRMLTRRDPWANLLRGTLAASSAGIGGADSVSDLPFTAALGLPDAFARRLARNTQLVLLEEANLWRVADPVAGSGAFEGLTAGLVEEAWARFGEIEREGGIVQSLATGALAGRIAAVRARRESDTSVRREPIVGTSEFPNLAEVPVSVLVPSPRDRGTRGDSSASSFDPLPSLRAAEPFENLRDRSDEILARTGARPRVVLVSLGSLAESSARAAFAGNAFEAVGIEARPAGPGAVDALAAAFRDAGADAACLCSSDAVYASEGAAAARALRDVGARRVFLAGRPGDGEAALREAGVTDFLHAGSNLPSLLGGLVDPA